MSRTGGFGHRKVRDRLRVDWAAIQRHPYPKKFHDGAFHWVSDESIARCLRERHFEDVSADHHNQPGSHHHAARVASLVMLLALGVKLHRIHLHVSKRYINVEDGNHRLRAYQYLHMESDMRAMVTGRRWRVVREAMDRERKRK